MSRKILIISGGDLEGWGARRARELLAEGARVTVLLDRSQDFSSASLVPFTDERCLPAYAAISDFDAVSQVIARHEEVHCQIDSREGDTELFLRDTVLGTVNVLDALRANAKAKQPQRAFFSAPNASSSAVTALALNAAERFIQMYAREHGVSATYSGNLSQAKTPVPLAPRDTKRAKPLTQLQSGRVLVTGGNGFIGSHVVDSLLDSGFSVTILDCLGKPYRKEAEFVLGDVRDRATVRALSAEHDGIINLAGVLGTSETVDYPRSTVSFNLLGALPIFDAAREFKIPVTHVTVGNYWMNNPYAITKCAAERLALHYNLEHGTKIAVVRGLNAYGERQKSAPVRKLMPNLILPALRGEPIVIYGDGRQKMDMIYVKDLAEILVKALVLDHGAWDKVFEAGSSAAPMVTEICQSVLTAAASKSLVHHLPMRAGEEEGATVCGNAETLLPLGVSVSDLLPLEAGIARTLDFYRAHLGQY